MCRYRYSSYEHYNEFRWGVGDLTLIPRLNVDLSGTNYLGWVSESVHSRPYLGMKLYRVPDVVAKENFFICNHKERHRSILVGIFYPSE